MSLLSPLPGPPEAYLAAGMPLASSPTRASYHEHLVALGAGATIQGIWTIVGRPEAEFGWKIHLSSTQTEATALIETVVPLLLERVISFKAARDSDILALLNEGEFGPTQIGKFMTLYPDTDRDCLSMAEELAGRTCSFSGPRIVTDLHIGGAVYVRYGGFSPRLRRDRLGNLLIDDPQGRGEYRVPFQPPDGVENPFQSYPSGAEVRGGNVPIGDGYLIVRPLKGNAKGTVSLALDLRRQSGAALVVLKEGRRHCVSDSEGRDMWSRLRHQYLAHTQLAGMAPVPAAFEPFERGDSLYLPVAFIDGRDFGERPASPYASLSAVERDTLLSDFRRLIEAVAALHDAGFVHRDLSPNNVRFSLGGRAWLLDLELCHRIGDPAPPFSHGTPGFIAPQQVVGSTPTPADDIFSVGALMILGLTGLDPHRFLFAGAAEAEARLSALSGAPEGLCRLAARAVADDPLLRPTLDEMAARLAAFSQSRHLPGRSTPTGEAFECDDLVHEALTWILESAPTELDTGLWLSPEIEASNHSATLRLPHGYHLYRSASRGVAGVVYLIARLQQAGIRDPRALETVERSVDWLLDHHPTPDDQLPGLHFGEAGVAVAIAEAVKAGLIDPGEWLLPYIREALQGPLDWPDLTHGAAGQGLAALICAELLEERQLASLAERSMIYLLERQQADGSWKVPEGVAGMTDQAYTGFAHGVAGIGYFLVHCHRHLGSAGALQAAERAAAWLLEHARREGAVLWWPLVAGGRETWRWWCHGGPGIAILMLELFAETGREAYAEAARAALRAHPFQVRYSNLSQCHGLCGLGEILLEAHTVLGEAEWRQRARDIASTLGWLARRDSVGARWLVENPHCPTADLMIGCGGVAHFLARAGGSRAQLMGMPLAYGRSERPVRFGGARHHAVG